MSYTQAGKKADVLIESYLDIIIPVILQNIPGVRSIILGGGAGRGEGSVGMQEGKLTPQNDLELFLLTDESVSENLINKTANLAIRKLDLPHSGAAFYEFKHEIFANTFYIDMKAIPLKELPYKLPMFRYYELKYASQVVWGKDYRSLLPDFQLSDIPLAEGLRLLLNRMALLVLYYSHDFQKKYSFSGKHGLMYLGSKAFTDLPGALTLLSGRYTPTYRSRLKTIIKTYKKDFPALAKEHSEIPSLAEEGLNFKLNPDFSANIDLTQLWQKQKTPILAVFLHFSNRFFGRQFTTVDQIADFLYNSGYRYYYHPYLDWTLKHRFHLPGLGKLLTYFLIPFLNLMFFGRILTKQHKFYPRVLFNFRAPDLTFFSAMLYLLYASDGKTKINKQYLVKARYYLAKTYPLTPVSHNNLIHSWEETRQDFADAFVLFSLLKIV